MQEEALEESGWKLVHGDVFRPPMYRRLLVALTGAGIQIFMSTFVVIGNAVQSLLLVFWHVCGSCHTAGQSLRPLHNNELSYLLV